MSWGELTVDYGELETWEDWKAEFWEELETWEEEVSSINITLQK
jgi:hypothetical protein